MPEGRMPKAEVRPPGIYRESFERHFVQPRLGKTAVPGFIGIAERGPVNEPVRITDVKEFYRVFGNLASGGVLAYAVEGFFRNGGKECYIVRVVPRGGAKGGATKAFCTLYDRAKEPCLLVEARSEGEYGNKIRVSLRQAKPRVQTFLTLDAPCGACSVTVRSAHGFSPGTMVKIRGTDFEEYRFLTGVQEKTLLWAESEPLKRDLLASSLVFVEPVEFRLEVQSPFGTEAYTDLSMHPASPQFIERVVSSKSSLITVRRLVSSSPSPLDMPEDCDDCRLEGGDDNIDDLSVDDFVGIAGAFGERTGLCAFELVPDVDLLAAPDCLWLFRRNRGRQGMGFSTLKDVEVLHEAMISQCERMQNRFAILSSPFPDDITRTREYRLLFDTNFAALYFPWVVIEKGGQKIEVPPCGHVAGIMARCDDAFGVFRSPANEVLEHAQDLTMVLHDEDLGMLNAEGICCLKSASARGLRVFGARVMTSDPQYRYLSVRRTMNALRRAIEEYLQWVVFEPNMPSLWKTITRHITGFLTDLWRNGYFAGATPEEAFYVKCDDETNPPEERDAGRLHVEVGVAPVRPAEFMMVRLAQEMHVEEKGV
jgi:phage tail sheath protein FI